MASMKAIRYHEYGGAESLRYEDAPRPTPGPGELLIKVRAASVNPIDWKLRAGHLKAYMPLTFPVIPGRDLSGVVEDVGRGVVRFKPGDEVYAMTDGARGGTYAEYAIANEAQAAMKPASIDHAHAAAIPLTALCAWQALFEKAKLARGQKILIHAAAGGVGSIAVQLAKWRGAQIVGTASAKSEGLVLKLGADMVIDYAKAPFESIVHDADVVLDSIGGDTQERSLRALKKGGILVALAQPPSAERASNYGVRAEMLSAHPSAEQLAEIAKLIDAGIVKPIVASILPLSDARRAHEMSQTSHTRGKIVLVTS